MVSQSYKSIRSQRISLFTTDVHKRPSKDDPPSSALAPGRVISPTRIIFDHASEGSDWEAIRRDRLHQFRDWHKRAYQEYWTNRTASEVSRLVWKSSRVLAVVATLRAIEDDEHN